MKLSSGSADSYNQSSPRTQSPRHGYSGLVPYCGILEVGAHEIQPVPDEVDVPSLHFDDEWICPSSQESHVTDAVPSNVFTPLYANN